MLDSRPPDVFLEQWFPTWGICNPRGTFKVGNRSEKYIDILFISKYLYCTYVGEYYFKNHYMLIVRYICDWSCCNTLSKEILRVHSHLSKC